MKELTPYQAIDLWQLKQITADEVLKLSGYDRLSVLAHDYEMDQRSAEAAALSFNGPEHERDELVDFAWQYYQSLLAERPAYLDQIVERLQMAKRRDLQRFAARLNARRKSSRGESVIPFGRH